MAKIKGSLLLLPSLAFGLGELYFLIIQPLSEGDNFTITTAHYWALAIPMFLFAFIMASMGAWIGYTMIVTAEPIKFNYDEAYDIAVDSDVESEEKA